MTVSTIELTMPDGLARALLGQPADGPGAPVLFFMDAMGLRPALEQMVETIAAAGYTVLAPDVFYRSQPYGPFDPVTIFGDRDALRQLGRLNREFRNDLFERDAGAYLDAVSAHGNGGPVRTVGYCMGGRCALMLAGFHGDRVIAAASFHGGELAVDRPDSPHTLAAATTARVYIGVAETDAFFEAEEEGRLAAALRAGEVNHVIETYPGTQHGFAVPDLPVYDPAAARTHQERLFALFAGTR